MLKINSPDEKNTNIHKTHVDKYRITAKVSVN